jgi:hypothetical protein
MSFTIASQPFGFAYSTFFLSLTIYSSTALIAHGHAMLYALTMYYVVIANYITSHPDSIPVWYLSTIMLIAVPHYYSVI